MDPNRHPPALGRPLGPRRLCLLNGNQDKMNPLREGERSPVGSSHLPGNRCPGPTVPIAVSHPQNTSPPINHSGWGGSLFRFPVLMKVTHGEEGGTQAESPVTLEGSTLPYSLL